MSATPTFSSTVPEPANRIDFIDVLRGMAILGITVTNVLSQSQPEVYEKNMNLEQSITGANFYSWLVEMSIFEGPVRGLLSLVFGTSFLLFMQRLCLHNTTQKPALIYYKRLFWLFMFGILNTYVLLWPGDILCAYAVFAVVLYPLRNLSPRTLIFTATLILMYGVYHETNTLYAKKDFIAKGEKLQRQQSEGLQLSREQQQDLVIWRQFQQQHSEKTVISNAKKEVSFITQASYPELIRYCWEYEREYPVSGYFAWWDVLPFFFIGMAVWQTGFITGRADYRTYLVIATAGISMALLMLYFELHLRYSSRFNEMIITKNTFADFYQIRRLAQTMGYLSLLILLYQLRPLQRFFKLFIPLGKMSLSIYLLQGIITPGIFLAFGWFGQLERYQIYEVLVLIWILQWIFGWAWLRIFRSGPFEWLLHSLIWSRIQPLRK